MTRAGLFVTLDETGADGFVPISQLGDYYFIHDEATHTVTGETTGEQFQMGQHVDVRLVEAAPVAGALRFEMLSEGVVVKSIPRSRKSNQRPGARRNAGARRGSSRRGKW